ncbi:MAG: gamma-glutamylcyclotransferase [Sphingomicrobium sp.]
MLDGEPDALAGFVLTPLAINDPAVVKLSGLAVHQPACATGKAADRLSGMLFALNAAELAAADAYEVAAMTWIEIDLESGRRRFVDVEVDAKISSPRGSLAEPGSSWHGGTRSGA